MIKMARRYFKAIGSPERFRLITIDGAFHGRTLACATAGSPEKIVGFEPPVEGFDRVAFNDIAALKKAIRPETMGVLLEPIQGEGGMRPHSKEYMQELRKICDEHKMLLLLDEVQCGAGRTGWFCAHELYGIKPDLVAIAKGIGGGFPISVCLATEAVGAAMEPGTHGSTFGGNPLAISVAIEVLDIILGDGFLDRVKEISAYLLKNLESLKSKYSDKIIEVRGKGLMLGLKLAPDINAADTVTDLRKYKLLSIPASDNVVRITPPLIIEEQHCNEAIEKLDQLFSKI